MKETEVKDFFRERPHQCLAADPGSIRSSFLKDRPMTQGEKI